MPLHYYITWLLRHYAFAIIDYAIMPFSPYFAWHYATWCFFFIFHYYHYLYMPHYCFCALIITITIIFTPLHYYAYHAIRHTPHYAIIFHINIFRCYAHIDIYATLYTLIFTPLTFHYIIGWHTLIFFIIAMPIFSLRHYFHIIIIFAIIFHITLIERKRPRHIHY